MSTRLTLAASLLVAAVVVLVTPMAVRYGGIAPWGPWLPGIAAAVALGLAITHGRRPDRSRAGVYLPVSVMVGCVFFAAWMAVQRLG